MLGVICLVYYVHSFRLHSLITFLIFTLPLFLKPGVLICHTQCPDCYDNDLCNSLHNGDVQLSWLSTFFLILNPNITKSVFFGVLNGTENVVLKSMTKRCTSTVKHNYAEQARDVIFDDISWDCSECEPEITHSVVICPNVKTLDILFTNINDDLESLRNTRRIWFNIQMSIEPLLLKLIGNSPNMPIPRYIGSCGDIIIKEYKGTPLTQYFYFGWMERAFLGVQLLKMAENFTFSHESLIFYFTDFSPYNIVIDEFGNAFMIDLDDVIIAERDYTGYGKGKDLDNVHCSVVSDPLKLATAPADVCKHSVSDHNYFAVCRYILLYSDEMGKGLLEDMPENGQEDYEMIRTMIKECAEPTKYANRIIPGRLLKKLLGEMLSGFIWK